MIIDFKPPAVLREAHRLVSAARPGRKVIVAGGAMRDAYMARPHTDIDVFVESRRDLGGFPTTLEHLERELGKPGRYLAHVDYLDWQREVTGFANYSRMGEDIQIVGLDYRPLTTMRAIHRMDIGLCQIGWDGVNTECTKAFLADVKNKTLTVTRCTQPADVVRTRSRIEKFQRDKYADHIAVWDSPLLPYTDPRDLRTWLGMTDEQLMQEQEKWNREIHMEEGFFDGE